MTSLIAAALPIRTALAPMGLTIRATCSRPSERRLSGRWPARRILDLLSPCNSCPDKNDSTNLIAAKGDGISAGFGAVTVGGNFKVSGNSAYTVAGSNGQAAITYSAATLMVASMLLSVTTRS
jgi:hypothetical protein